MFICFFFSSRRRHTRWNCDWSSDVCSSDLYLSLGRYENLRTQSRSFSSFGAAFVATEEMTLSGQGDAEAVKGARVSGNFLTRSEERRVGKECRSRWSRHH